MKMVPLKKQSKRNQREYHAAQRGSWNGLYPVTRVVPNKKAYDRNKAKQTVRRDNSPEITWPNLSSLS